MQIQTIKDLELNFSMYFHKKFRCLYNTAEIEEIYNQGEGPDGWLMSDNDTILLINYFKEIDFNKLNSIKKIASDNFEKVYSITVSFNDNNQVMILCELNNEKIQLSDIQDKFKIDAKKEEEINKLPHNIHQWIHDNGIQMDRVHKQLLIAFILIGLKLRPREVRRAKTASDVIEIIRNILKIKYSNDSQFIKEFDFLYTPSPIRQHIKEIVSKFPYQLGSDDTLNRFFAEFQLYQKNNEAEKGIVFTPNDIVDIMVSNCKIDKDSSVLDICAGSGSFLVKSALKCCRDLRGCEIVNSEYVLAKCNFIINGLNCNKLKCNDSFKETFEPADYVILNPPFGMKAIKYTSNDGEVYKKEQAFIIKALELCKKGASFIIPISNFTENKQNTKFKKYLLSNFKIDKLILLNDVVFKPNAAQQCLIVCCTKCDKSELSQTTTFENRVEDGYIIVNSVRTKTKDENITIESKTIDVNNDWTKKVEQHNDFGDDDFEKMISEIKENYYESCLNEIIVHFKQNIN